MESVFAVVFETEFVTKVLFQGTKEQCKQFIRKNSEMCDSCVFVQELELV